MFLSNRRLRSLIPLAWLALTVIAELGANEVTVSDVVFTPNVIDAQASGTTDSTVVLTFRLESSEALTTVEAGLAYDENLTGSDMGRFLDFAVSCDQIFPIGSSTTRVSGTEMDGIYRTVIPIRRSMPPGVWKAQFILAPSFGCRFREFPQRLVVINGGDYDDDPPEVTALSWPTTVDVTNGDQLVTIDFNVTDESGIDRIFLYLTGQSGVRNEPEGGLQKLSGDEFSAVYRGTYRIRKYSIPEYLQLTGSTFDVLQNGKEIDRSDEPYFQVVNNGQANDTAPVLENLTFSESSIDVTDGEQSIVATVEVSDDFEGPIFGSFRPQVFQGRNGISQSVSGGQLSFQSQLENGNWSASTSINFFSSHHPVQLCGEIELWDTYGNFAIYSKNRQFDEIPVGQEKTLRVSASKPLSGPFADSSPPEMTALTISPQVIDVGDGPQEVTIEVDLVDLESGIQFVYGFLAGQFLFFELISGDERSGRWKATVIIPSEINRRRAIDLSMEAIDGLRNYVSWRNDGDVFFDTPFPIPVNYRIQNYTEIEIPDRIPVSSVTASVHEVDVTDESKSVTIDVLLEENATSASLTVDRLIDTVFPEPFGLREFMERVGERHYRYVLNFNRFFPPGQYLLGVDPANGNTFTTFSSDGSYFSTRRTARELPFGSIRAIKVQNDNFDPGYFPDLLQVSFSRNDLDLSTGDQDVTVTARFEGGTELLESVYLSVDLDEIMAPAAFFGGLSTELTRDAEAVEGTYKGVLRVPCSVPAGTYQLSIHPQFLSFVPRIDYGVSSSRAQSFPESVSFPNIVNLSSVFDLANAPRFFQSNPVFDFMGDRNQNGVYDPIDDALGVGTLRFGYDGPTPEIHPSPVDGRPSLRFAIDPYYEVGEDGLGGLLLEDGRPLADDMGFYGEVSIDGKEWCKAPFRNIGNFWYELPLPDDEGFGFGRLKAVERVPEE